MGQAKRNLNLVAAQTQAEGPIVLELSEASAAQLQASFQAWKAAEAQFQRDLAVYLAARGVDAGERANVSFDFTARRLVVSRPGVPAGTVPIVPVAAANGASGGG